MKDIRITFRGEDFAAVSQSMIALGVAFRVEPLEADEEETPAAPAPVRKAAKPKPAKRGRSAAPTPATQPARASEEGAGAARLRAMIERNRAAVSRPALPEGGGEDAGGSEEQSGNAP